MKLKVVLTLLVLLTLVVTIHVYAYSASATCSRSSHTYTSFLQQSPDLRELLSVPTDWDVGRDSYLDSEMLVLEN